MREEKGAVKIFLTKKEIEALRTTAKLYKFLSKYKDINDNRNFAMKTVNYADLSDELVTIAHSAEQRVWFSDIINFIEEKN